MSEPLEVKRLPTFEQIKSDTMVAIGPVVINTVRGPIEANDISGFTAMTVDAGGVPRSVAVMLYEPAPSGKVGIGFITQMSAVNARAMAASLMRLADRVAPVSPNG